MGIPQAGDKVEMNSPHGLFKRTDGIATIEIKNGATGRLRYYTRGNEALVDWDTIAIEVPVPQHWIRKRGWYSDGQKE